MQSIAALLGTDPVTRRPYFTNQGNRLQVGNWNPEGLTALSTYVNGISCLFKEKFNRNPGNQDVQVEGLDQAITDSQISFVTKNLVKNVIKTCAMMRTLPGATASFEPDDPQS